MNSSDRSNGVSKIAGSTFLLQVIFFFLGWLSAIMIQFIFPWSWRPGIYGTIITLVVVFSLLVSGLIFRRAYIFHIIAAFIPLGPVITLMAAGSLLVSGDIVQLSVVSILSLLNVYIYYRKTSKELTSVKNIERLDIKNGIWDLTKPIVYDPEEEKQQKSLVQIVIPLAVMVGTLLSRNPAIKAEPFLSILLFFLSYMLMSGTGMHLASSTFLKQLENGNGIAISL